MLKSSNTEKEKYLEKTFPNIQYVDDFHELQDTDGQNILIMDQSLKKLLENHPSLYYAPSMTAAKAESLFTCIEYAILRTPLKQHNILI